MSILSGVISNPIVVELPPSPLTFGITIGTPTVLGQLRQVTHLLNIDQLLLFAHDNDDDDDAGREKTSME